MKKQNVLIVTAFYNYDYNIRIKYLKNFFIQRGYIVDVISSDFDHRNKCVQEPINEVQLIHVPSYKRNLSIRRMWSHYQFAKKAYQYCANRTYDLIYVITPPNFLFYFFSKLKEKQPDTKIIFETEDLWPESLPVSKHYKEIVKFPLTLWKNIRDKYIACADAIVYECELFGNYIARENNVTCPTKCIYLSKDDTFLGELSEHECYSSSKCIEFLYLGSINNLIDIDLILSFLKAVNKKKRVTLHIIGNGELLDKFLNDCEKCQLSYVNHGAIYDENEKQKVISKCHFALNIMKDTVFVGATMKSLEYFHYGIPLINNIVGDTHNIIEQYACGYNLGDINDVVDRISMLSPEQYLKMKMKTRKVFEENFSPSQFEQKFEELCGQIGLEDTHLQ